MIIWRNLSNKKHLTGFCRTFLSRLAYTKVYRIKLRRWKILGNISFRAPKRAKNSIFWALLIFEHSCYAKINEITILPNMSKSKDNEAKKFSQVTECNMNQKNQTQNMVEKLFPELFLKNKNWLNLWKKCLKFYKISSYCSF